MGESKGVEKLYCASANQKKAPRSNIKNRKNKEAKIFASHKFISQG